MILYPICLADEFIVPGLRLATNEVIALKSHAPACGGVAHPPPHPFHLRLKIGWKIELVLVAESLRLTEFVLKLLTVDGVALSAKQTDVNALAHIGDVKGLSQLLLSLLQRLGNRGPGVPVG
jgi:hypothetical protein